MSEEHQHLLDTIIASNPRLTSQALSAELARRVNVQYATRTIRRYRVTSLGYHSVHERLREKLTASHIARRLAFTVAHFNTNFHLILFSDEKCFILKNTGNVVFIKAGESVPEREVHDVKASVWVWGCVWYNGRTTLHTTSSRMNGNRYTAALANHLLPSIPAGTRHRFMQDGDPSHTCKHTQNWLRDFGVSLLPNWPPHSPDLNAIEYIWNWMRMFVNKEAPNTRASLKRAVRLAWQQLPQSKIQSCIDHIPDMIRSVNTAGGTYV
jgi:transposase